MLSYLIVLFLLTISFVLIRYKGLLGWIMFFMLCGSVTDSAGILYFIDSIFPIYKLLIWLLSFSLMAYSVHYILFVIKDKTIIRWYVIPFITSFFLIICSIYVNSYDIADISTTLIMSGIPYFFIWFVGRYSKGRESLLIYLVLIHAIISLVIILGKENLAEIFRVQITKLLLP